VSVIDELREEEEDDAPEPGYGSGFRGFYRIITIP
jgi:hypothetical protein